MAILLLKHRVNNVSNCLIFYFNCTCYNQLIQFNFTSCNIKYSHTFLLSIYCWILIKEFNTMWCVVLLYSIEIFEMPDIIPLYNHLPSFSLKILFNFHSDSEKNKRCMNCAHYNHCFIVIFSVK